MTIPEFLIEFEQAAKGRFFTLDGGFLRDTGDDKFCPLCLVACLTKHCFYYNSSWMHAAEALGMGAAEAESIVLAADGRGATYNNHLRDQLLACVTLAAQK